MNKKRIVILFFLFVIVFGLGTGAGIFIQRNNAQPPAVTQDNTSELQLVEQAWNITRDNYVDKTATQPKTLAYGTIAGMINSLGDTGHSTFLTPDELKQQNNFVQGKYEGIGVEVQEKNGHVVIVAPKDGSPAQKGGLRSGEIILKVNGQPVTTVSSAVNLILGPAGTSVSLTIQNSSGDTRDVTLVRATITLVDVTWQQLPGTSIAHLRLSSFSKGAARDLYQALTAIKNQGDSGIILDLRDNPGGLLEEAVGVTSCFIKSGNVLLIKDINEKITSVPVVRVGTVTDLPLVVLINQGTASAAEITAGALQEAGRCKLVGETTFGTGTVLEQFNLQDGSALILAVQEWLTPSGKTIWHTGMTPDIVVALASGSFPLFPESEKSLTADQLKATEDQQLLRAINLLSQAK